MKTFFANPKIGFVESKSSISKALSKLIDSGNYILGENVLRFEEEFNDYLGSKGYFISCASGTDAITLSIKINGIKPGSKIIVPSHTAAASILGILNAGCIPIYVDVNESNLLISFEEIKRIISRYKCKAILAVHLYGHGIEINKLKKLIKNSGIKIIEDCAQSTGTLINNKQSGTLSDAGCFSFFPTKNLGALGDGGGIWVPSKKMKDRAIALRQYGWDKKRNITIEGGINSRLDELQAAILRIKLKKLPKEIKKRRNIAKIYDKYLDSRFIRISYSPNQVCSYHLFVVRTKSRSKLLRYMAERNIFLGIHYYPPNHKNGVLSKYTKHDLKITNQISREVISLPLYPELQKKDQLSIIKKLNEFK